MSVFRVVFGNRTHNGFVMVFMVLKLYMRPGPSLRLITSVRPSWVTNASQVPSLFQDILFMEPEGWVGVG